jgi:hypothetical protein
MAPTWKIIPDERLDIYIRGFDHYRLVHWSSR